LGEQSQRTKHAREESSLGSGLSLTIHGHLDSLVIGGALQGFGLDCDEDCEGLAPPAPPHEPQVAELGELVLHDGGAVPDLPAVVVIVPTLDTHQGSIRDLLEREDFESCRESFVTSPVVGEGGAEDTG